MSWSSWKLYLPEVLILWPSHMLFSSPPPLPSLVYPPCSIPFHLSPLALPFLSHLHQNPQQRLCSLSSLFLAWAAATPGIFLKIITVFITPDFFFTPGLCSKVSLSFCSLPSTFLSTATYGCKIITASASNNLKSKQRRRWLTFIETSSPRRPLLPFFPPNAVAVCADWARVLAAALIMRPTAGLGFSWCWGGSEGGRGLLSLALIIPE